MTGALSLFLAALAWSTISSSVAVGTEAGRSSVAPVMGVKHLLQGTLIMDRTPAGKAERDKAGVDLRVTVRISDHAPDSRFFGHVLANFSSVGLGEARTIWEDVRCHRDRGLPKVTVLRVEGFGRNGEDRTEISAAMRRVGKRVPHDEIIIRKRLTPPSAMAGLAMRAVTSASNLVFDLQLSTVRCRF